MKRTKWGEEEASKSLASITATVLDWCSVSDLSSISSIHALAEKWAKWTNFSIYPTTVHLQAIICNSFHIKTLWNGTDKMVGTLLLACSQRSGKIMIISFAVSVYPNVSIRESLNTFSWYFISQGFAIFFRTIPISFEIGKK